MSLQSYKFPIDFMNNLEPPVIYIAKKNKEILGSVSIYEELTLTFNLNAYQEASFKIPRDVNGKYQENFELFQEDMLIMIPGISWYKIHVETNIEQNGITKTVTANSLECTLCNKKLIDFQANSDDAEEENSIAIRFYDSTNPDASLLTKILNVSPMWSVGHVDSSLVNKIRIFDISDTDVYSFLTGDVSEAFNCLFIFDTFNCTVNAYDLDHYGSNSNIYVSMDNLAESMTETIDENSIITCYYVTGGDDIDISEVNPNGTRKIYNFDYYLQQFSPILQQKLKLYNEKYQSLKDPYEKVVLELQQEIEKIQELYTRSPLSANSTDWSTYGLYMLQSKQKSYQNINDVYCAQGMNIPSAFQYNLYSENLKLLNAVSAELTVRENEIETEMKVYESILARLKNIQSELDMNKWFTKEEWIELDSYVVEEIYNDDSFTTLDNTTESELFSMEKQLYDAAWKDLNKKCRPQYQYTTTLANILTIPEFKNFVPYFELGNFIMMRISEDTLVKLRLISFTIDYSNTSNISVTFSDAIRVHDIYEDTSSIQAQAHSAAMSFKFNKNQYDKSVNQSNFVAEMRKYGLDVATTQIHNSKNQIQIWDETGMTFRQWNDQKNDFDPEQIKIINNMMVFSDDGFKTSRMAIGKIYLPNGESAYGTIAEAIIGKLFLGEYLTLQNNSGTYNFDDSGFTATNGVNTVKIQPNNSGELFSIYKGLNKQVYINSSGDVEFAGTLKSASGKFSGLVSGGEININNTFTVDQNGNMIAQSGKFSGEISASNVNMSTITGGVINGASINGGTITSSGVNGITVISGGSISTTTNNFTKIITVKNGDLECSINSVGFYCEGQNNNYTRISTGQIFLSNGTNHTTLTSEYLSNIEVHTDNLYISKGLTFYTGATRYGTLAGTTDRIVFKANGGNNDIPSVGWVRGFVNNQIPNSNNFAPRNHTHNEYISGVTVNDRGNSLAAKGSYTSYLYLSVSSSGTYKTVSGFHLLASDRRLKEEIVDAPDIKAAYMDFKPVHYKFRDDAKGTDDHYHYGLIAQDVLQSLKDHNIPTFNEALVGYDKTNDMWILDKNELHAMHVQMIQSQQREIDQLKNELHNLKEIIKK